MTPEKIKHFFPHASQSTIDANREPSGANPKSSVSNGPLAEGKAEKGDPRKRMVRIVSYRLRLADAEGLCPKWHVDALRYAGAIQDDTVALLDFAIAQKKVSKKSQEKTLIVIS